MQLEGMSPDEVVSVLAKTGCVETRDAVLRLSSLGHLVCKLGLSFPIALSVIIALLEEPSCWALATRVGLELEEVMEGGVLPKDAFGLSDVGFFIKARGKTKEGRRCDLDRVAQKLASRCQQIMSGVRSLRGTKAAGDLMQAMSVEDVEMYVSPVFGSVEETDAAIQAVQRALAYVFFRRAGEDVPIHQCGCVEARRFA